MTEPYEYTYQPPFLSFLKHRATTNPNLLVEATLYALALGTFTYILLSITSYKTVFFSLLAVVFFYALFTTNNRSIKKFMKQVNFVATNSSNQLVKPKT